MSEQPIENGPAPRQLPPLDFYRSIAEDSRVVDPELVTIANVEPRELNGEVAHALASRAVGVGSAQERFDAAIESVVSAETDEAREEAIKKRDLARKELGDVLAASERIDSGSYSVSQEDVDIADKIEQRRQELFKPVQRLAAWVTALAMGGGTGSFTYFAIKDSNLRAAENLQDVNAELGSEVFKIENVNNVDWTVIGFTGLLGATVGAFAGIFGTELARSRIAQIRAKKKLHKLQSEQPEV